MAGNYKYFSTSALKDNKFITIVCASSAYDESKEENKFNFTVNIFTGSYYIPEKYSFTKNLKTSTCFGEACVIIAEEYKKYGIEEYNQVDLKA